MRQTSIAAYRAIDEGGLLSAMRLKVYKWLYHNGPATGREMSEKLSSPGEKAMSYHKRLSELERVGVIASAADTRLCGVTGYMALVWDVTDRVPVKHASSATRRKLRDEVVNAACHLASVSSSEDDGERWQEAYERLEKAVAAHQAANK